MIESRQHPPRLLVALALLAVYVIWGSTYLAILFAIDSIPPLTMAGVRFTIAGWVLFAILRALGHAAPSRQEWISTAIVGILLLGVGNGGVTWAEQRIPSGVAALILAGTPAWMVILDWARPGGVRPPRLVLVGVALGLAGIALLVLTAGDVRVENIDAIGAVVVMISSLAWAIGSISSRSLKQPSSAMQVTAMQMIMAGAALTTAGAISGEWMALDLSGITGSSVLALTYLIVFGSWVGFSAYVWLLKSTTPAIASTYAYVNPAIAVFLGWAFAGETVGRWTIAAMAVIIVGVAMITLTGSRPAGGTETAVPLIAPRQRVGWWGGGRRAERS